MKNPTCTTIKLSQTNLDALTIIISVEVGSIYESTANNGISHLLEHIIIRTFKQKWQAVAPDRTYILTSINATTYKDHTEFYCRTQPKDLELLIEQLKNAIFQPDITGFLTSERAALLQEIESTDSLTRDYEDLLACTYYNGTSAGLPTRGTTPSISQITHQETTTWHKQFYIPRHLIIIHSDPRTSSPIIENPTIYQAPHSDSTISSQVIIASNPVNYFGWFGRIETARYPLAIPNLIAFIIEHIQVGNTNYDAQITTLNGVTDISLESFLTNMTFDSLIGEIKVVLQKTIETTVGEKYQTWLNQFIEASRFEDDEWSEPELILWWWRNCGELMDIETYHKYLAGITSTELKHCLNALISQATIVAAFSKENNHDHIMQIASSMHEIKIST